MLAVGIVACTKEEASPVGQVPPPVQPLKINQTRLRGFWKPVSVVTSGFNRTVEFQNYLFDWTPTNTIRCTRVNNDSIIGTGTYSVQADSLQLNLVLNGADARFANLALLTGSYELVGFDGANQWSMRSKSQAETRFTMAPSK
jgi:hypothetical protein